MTIALTLDFHSGKLMIKTNIENVQQTFQKFRINVLLLF